MKFTTTLLTVSLALTLCGCATTKSTQTAPEIQPIKPTISKAQCRKIKSYHQGVHDGQQGKSRAEFATLVDTCREHKVKLQPKRYLAGWTVGLKSYCHTKHLYKLGKTGEPFPAACEKHHGAEKAYNKGKKTLKKTASLPSPTEAPIQLAVTGSVSELENQLQEIKESKKQIQNDLEFFREGVVHVQREHQLQELIAREENVRAQITSLRHTA